MMPPVTLSEMLFAIASQAKAHAVAQMGVTPEMLGDLATTLDACAEAARDLEDRAEPPAVHVPPILPPNVIPFPMARAAR